MKKLFPCVLLLSLIALSPAVAQKAAAPAPAAPEATTAEVSYAFGILIGKNLATTSVSIDWDAFLQGARDATEKKQTIADDKATEIIQAAIAKASAKKAEENASAGTTFLAKNGKRSGVTTTASGLQFEVIKAASGAKPVATDTVKVDYVGTLLDGTEFDSSVKRGEPAVFPLNRVIPGWTEGIQLMSVGAKYKFYIPAALAYGESGAGGVIPANATLVFEVTLIGIEPPQAEAEDDGAQ